MPPFLFVRNRFPRHSPVNIKGEQSRPPDAFMDELIGLVPGIALSDMVIDKINKNVSSMKGSLPGNWRDPRGFLQSSTQAPATAADSEKTPKPRPLTEEEKVVDLSF